MTVTISVAMATYNGEKYIKQQLETIASQTYMPYELVVCDDGSSDETIGLIEVFAISASFPVRIFINESNLGFANNFLKCASLCAGDWVAFCDQDDIWLPQKLATIKNVIDTSSDDLVLVYHAAELVNENLESLGRRLPVICGDRVTPVAGYSGFWFVGGCVMCFKSTLLFNIDSSLRPRDNYQFNKGWENNDYAWMPHDKWLCMLANISGEIASVAQVLSLYRRHGFALTGSHDESTAAVRVKKSSETGVDAYKFLSSISLETANSLLRISNDVVCDVSKSRLIAGSEKFRNISFVFDMRSRLYASKNVRLKVVLFSSLISSRAYWGDRFLSLGFASFLKDFTFVVGALSLFKNWIRRKND